MTFIFLRAKTEKGRPILLHILLSLYFVFLSWSAWFAIGPWARINILILGISCIFTLFYIIQRGSVRKNWFDFSDFILIIFFISIIFVTIFVSPDKKSLSYIMAYVFTFGFGYSILKIGLLERLSINNILTYNCAGVIFTACITLFSFAMENFFGISIQKIVPRFGPEPNATVLGALTRAYGVSEEPTNQAFYFVTMGPLAVWYLFEKQGVTSKILAFVILVALICTFSAAGIIAFATGLSVVAFVKIAAAVKFGVKFVKKRFFIIVMSALAGFVSVFWFLFDQRLFLLSPIFEKILNYQHSMRYERAVAAVEYIQMSPFHGIGLGNVTTQDGMSAINWYLNLAAEAGILPTILIGGFLLISARRIFASETLYRMPLIMGTVSGMTHLLAISTFYHPYLWTLFAISWVFWRCGHNRILGDS